MNVEELSHRLTHVERSARRWRLAASGLALALIAMVGIAQTSKPSSEPDDAAPRAGRTPVSLSVVNEEPGRVTLYRMWSDGTIERTQTPIFDFRGNDKWELLRRP